MSKAFTKEDDVLDKPVLRPLTPLLPPGVKNYITPEGERRLRAELDQLTQIERPRLATLPGANESKSQLQTLDHRIAYLGQSLQTAEIVQPPATPESVVRFGATVTVRNEAGEKTQYRLVGIDETDLDKNWVSWRSPIARALLNAGLGQRVKFRFPDGEEELEIVRVIYE